ncbi:MAG: DoxX family protein [Candidatus Paceibacteria bacterium]
MNHDKKTGTLKFFGRVLMSVIFLTSGWSKLAAFAGTVALVGTVFPFPEVLTVIAIILEFGGALLLLLGYRTRVAAYTLIVFTIIATLGFHLNLADQLQAVQFMKNLAILGGLLYVVAAGAGSYSLDGKKIAQMGGEPA